MKTAYSWGARGPAIEVEAHYKSTITSTRIFSREKCSLVPATITYELEIRNMSTNYVRGRTKAYNTEEIPPYTLPHDPPFSYNIVRDPTPEVFRAIGERVFDSELRASSSLNKNWWQLSSVGPLAYIITAPTPLLWPLTHL